MTRAVSVSEEEACRRSVPAAVAETVAVSEESCRLAKTARRGCVMRAVPRCLSAAVACYTVTSSSRCPGGVGGGGGGGRGGEWSSRAGEGFTRVLSETTDPGA